MPFKERLKEIRKDKGLHQKEMAEHIGVSLSSLQRYELGSGVPDVNALVELAKDGYNIHWLLTGDGEKFSWKKGKKAGILYHIEMWLEEEKKEESNIYEWFRIQFEKAFPDYKKWKEEKEESEAAKAYTSSRKVA